MSTTTPVRLASTSRSAGLRPAFYRKPYLTGQCAPSRLRVASSNSPYNEQGHDELDSSSRMTLSSMGSTAGLRTLPKGEAGVVEAAGVESGAAEAVAEEAGAAAEAAAEEASARAEAVAEEAGAAAEAVAEKDSVAAEAAAEETGAGAEATAEEAGEAAEATAEEAGAAAEAVAEKDGAAAEAAAEEAGAGAEATAEEAGEAAEAAAEEAGAAAEAVPEKDGAAAEAVAEEAGAAGPAQAAEGEGGAADSAIPETAPVGVALEAGLRAAGSEVTPGATVDGAAGLAGKGAPEALEGGHRAQSSQSEAGVAMAAPTTPAAVPTPPPAKPPPAKPPLEVEYNEFGNPIGMWVEEEVVVVEEEGGPSPEEKAAMRAKALRLHEAHVPSQEAAAHKNWLTFTVPDSAVGGTPLTVYFNRKQSEVLRMRPHIKLHAGYNQWQLDNEGGPVVELRPSGISQSDGSDWWSVTIQIPEEAYEMNYVFSDGDGLFDNNLGQDFYKEVLGGMTAAEWRSASIKRSEAVVRAKQKADSEALAAAAVAVREAALERDVQDARNTLNDLKGGMDEMQRGAVPLLEKGDMVVWKTEPKQVVAGGTCKIMYNIKATNLAWLNVPPDHAPTINVGHNGWRETQQLEMRHVAISDEEEAEGEQWFEADVEVPVDAVALNFVAKMWEHWDNNGGKDYKVEVNLPSEFAGNVTAWTDSLLESVTQRIRATRLAKEAEEAASIAERMVTRRAAQEKAQAVTRRQVKHVLFTDPAEPQVGEEIMVYYSPNDTPLSGQPRIFLQGGWNRWMHPRGFGPVEMLPPGKQGAHFRATLKVPEDAYMMDFVFANVPSGDGIYDNRGGRDYHLPVEGALVQEAPLHVMHVAVEMAPICKVGGLADVVTSLGRATQEQGHLVEVILPRYDFLLSSPILQGNLTYETEFDWGGTRIFVSSAIVEGLRCFFIEPHNGFFRTSSVYGRYDDEIRFDFFCKAALEFLLQSQRQPDILHCHDWSTAAVARSYWEDYHAFGLWKPKVVFTIHNLNYGQEKIGQAAYYSQRFTTVSPTYAFETGAHPSIGSNVFKFMGIRNGIDQDIWDPETDQFLPMHYNSSNVVEGKAAARRRLQERLNLTTWGEKPLVAVVSRLTKQKGIHLIEHAAWRTLDRGGQFVLLGSAPDPKIQADFNNLASSLAGENSAFHFAYDEPLSHLVYAAADIVVVPSMFEPCGLTQMIAMRFGAVPCVRHTGGLKDTVFDCDFDKERAAWEMAGSSDWQRDNIDATNGFAFTGTDPDALDYGLNRALDAWWNDRQWFQSLQARVMDQDWSWNRPALDYEELYHAACRE